MAGLIPQSFIDELISRVNVVEVVAARVPLKKAGRDFKACCPFHDEKSPSFTVSESKQFYYCFGCGAKGNAVGFLMEYDRLEFPDAVDELARMAGMEVPHEAGPRSDEGLDEIYRVLAAAEKTYLQALRDSPEAVSYLKQRGIDGETAKTYRIGFAPDRWETLSAAAKSPAQRDRLIKAGLAGNRKDGSLYDKFRGRIIFPIHDTRGRPIAFGGRVLTAGEGPKYLNSPETPLFHKGSQLYGLYQVRQAATRPRRLLVVEGYMDVVALAQFGLPQCVATLGTATTTEHAELLFRNAPEVVFCFDGDPAGQRAAHRAMESVLPRLRDGRVARFLFLSDGDDPDSLIRREGRQAFAARIERATPLSDFFFSSHQAQVDMNSLDGRARLVELCQPGLKQIPDGAFRDMMFEELGKRAQSSSIALSALASGETGKTAKTPPARRKPTLVRKAISMLVHQPAIGRCNAPVEQLIDFDRPGIPLLVELFQWCRNHPTAKTAHLLAHWEGKPDERHLEILAQEDLLVEDDAVIDDEFRSAIVMLIEERALSESREIEAKLRLGTANLTQEEKDRYRQWQKRRGEQNANES